MAGELIIIVEDNQRSRKLVRDVLQFWGYRTLEAERGDDAVALAAAHNPALILMDIRLPDMDGVTALRQLRANPTTAAIPVVAVTAFAMRGDEEQFLGAGFDGYVSKPIDATELPGVVASYCARGPRGG